MPLHIAILDNIAILPQFRPLFGCPRLPQTVYDAPVGQPPMACASPAHDNIQPRNVPTTPTHLPPAGQWYHIAPYLLWDGPPPTWLSQPHMTPGAWVITGPALPGPHHLPPRLHLFYHGPIYHIPATYTPHAGLPAFVPACAPHPTTTTALQVGLYLRFCAIATYIHRGRSYIHTFLPVYPTFGLFCPHTGYYTPTHTLLLDTPPHHLPPHTYYRFSALSLLYWWDVPTTAFLPLPHLHPTGS